jgi:hypothetical protein
VSDGSSDDFADGCRQGFWNLSHTHVTCDIGHLSPLKLCTNPTCKEFSGLVCPVTYNQGVQSAGDTGVGGWGGWRGLGVGQRTRIFGSLVGRVVLLLQQTLVTAAGPCSIFTRCSARRHILRTCVL